MKSREAHPLSHCLLQNRNSLLAIIYYKFMSRLYMRRFSNPQEALIGIHVYLNWLKLSLIPLTDVEYNIIRSRIELSPETGGE